MKFHSVTAGLIDQVPEIRFNQRCNGNIEKRVRWAMWELVSSFRQGSSFPMPMVHEEELYQLDHMNYHEYAWIILRIHQNEWITWIWCLDSPWAFLGDLSQQAIPLEDFYPYHLHVHDALSQHPLGSALRFLTWQGGYKKCRPRPCRLKKHITGSIFIWKNLNPIIYTSDLEVFIRLSSVFQRISHLTFYCQAVWNHQNALAEWCRSLFVSSKCGHFRIPILLVALVALGIVRVPNRQENSLRPGPNVALNFESETWQDMRLNR